MREAKIEALIDFLDGTLPRGSGINGEWVVEEAYRSITCRNIFTYTDSSGFRVGNISFCVRFPMIKNCEVIAPDFKITAQKWNKITKEYWAEIKEYLTDIISERYPQNLVIDYFVKDKEAI